MTTDDARPAAQVQRLICRRLNKNEKSCIAHALMHLNANRIHQNDSFGGDWYCGDKAKFIKTHIKAIKLFESLLSPPTSKITGPQEETP